MATGSLVFQNSCRVSALRTKNSGAKLAQKMQPLKL